MRTAHPLPAPFRGLLGIVVLRHEAPREGRPPPATRPGPGTRRSSPAKPPSAEAGGSPGGSCHGELRVRAARGQPGGAKGAGRWPRGVLAMGLPLRAGLQVGRYPGRHLAGAALPQRWPSAWHKLRDSYQNRGSSLAQSSFVCSLLFHGDRDSQGGGGWWQ